MSIKFIEILLELYIYWLKTSEISKAKIIREVKSIKCSFVLFRRKIDKYLHAKMYIGPM